MPTPPQFKDLGKKAKDLFKKQYDYKNEIKVTSKTSGVKIESGMGSKFAGYSKANWTDEFLGDIEVEAHSEGVAKGQFKLCNVADGVNVTVAGAAAGDLSVEATYVQDMVAAMAKGSHNIDKGATALTASAVVGLDSISVGGQVNLDASGAPTDYNFGASYATSDLVAAVTTAKKAQDISLNVLNKWSSTTTLGASATHSLASGNQSFALGTDMALDKSTQVKLKVDSQGKVGTAVVHKLASPQMTVGVSSEFDVGGESLKATKFGISLSFGN